jgi:hemoglobin
MRHAPFVIGAPERDAWLRHMNESLLLLEGEGRIGADDAAELRAYLDMAANTLINSA